MAGRRHSALTSFAQRLTPVEVAMHWFRRTAEFGRVIAREYPDFPAPAPDGLYLRAQVEAWFARFHGQKIISGDAEEEALRIARSGR